MHLCIHYVGEGWAVPTLLVPDIPCTNLVIVLLQLQYHDPNVAMVML